MKTTFQCKNVKTSRKVKIPKARKFFMKYRKHNGQIHSYRISAPIEERNDFFTTYCFNHGIRSFNRLKILEVRELT